MLGPIVGENSNYRDYISDVLSNNSLMINTYHANFENALEEQLSLILSTISSSLTTLSDNIGTGGTTGFPRADFLNLSLLASISYVDNAVASVDSRLNGISAPDLTSYATKAQVSSNHYTKIEVDNSFTTAGQVNQHISLRLVPYATSDQVSTQLSISLRPYWSSQTILSRGYRNTSQVNKQITDKLNSVTKYGSFTSSITDARILSLSSVTEITTAVNKFATAMAVEAYRTRTWIAEIDRYLRVVNSHFSMVPEENAYMHETTAAGNPTTNQNGLLFTNPADMINGVAESFGMSFSALSSIISSADAEDDGGYRLDPSDLNQSIGNSTLSNSQYIQLLGIPIVEEFGDEPEFDDGGVELGGF
jgi:hypothetical protein